MQIFLKYCFYFIFTGCLFSQNTYRSVEEIESEWGGYASYQKDEMLSFCEFLFKEKHYERCLLSFFQLLLKLENDPIIPIVNYYIGRCYEELESYSLALKYYKQVLNMDEDDTPLYKAAYYRYMHTRFLNGDSDKLIEETINTKDPYLLIIQGYSYLKNNNFEMARTSFISAQSIFNHSHYKKLITPLYKIIEDVGSVKSYNKYSVLFSGLVIPGGGCFMLREYDEGKGIVATVSLLMLVSSWGKVINKDLSSNRFYYSEANSFPVYNSYDNIGIKNILEKKDKIPQKLKFEFVDNNRTPFLLGTGVLLSSAWYAYKRTAIKNSDFIIYYINKQLIKNPISDFLDFPEPILTDLIGK